MHSSESTEKELLKKVLLPLLEDFTYWFSRSSTLLESETMPFLSSDEQGNLLNRIKQAQAEVQTATMLFKVTDAGIDTKVLIPWHKLVGECWQVSRQWRTIHE
ncbi:DUF2605 domain-containing protein [Geminocystis herdmanii]|uniref:DUF2605 domain-containing protein n=1 Tax=Geminocystis herdmanii TaxID=669359 RepID=UPI000345EAD6|nr:DUF2605 domain-containing protein [Geminocystis herdmanii]